MSVNNYSLPELMIKIYLCLQVLLTVNVVMDSINCQDGFQMNMLFLATACLLWSK